MKIAIIGGGIAGLTTAVALRKVGIEAIVYEAAPEIKAVGAGLGLAANAIKALKKIEIDAAVMKEGRLLEAFAIKDQTGKQISKTDTLASSLKYGADNFTIHRANLHKVLSSFLQKEQIQTNKSFDRFEKKGDKIHLYFSDGSEDHADYLIAADGINSPIRKSLLPEAKIRYAGYTCWRAVIDYPTEHLIEASETWGPKGRFGIVPLSHNTLYWFACIKAKQNDARLKNYTVQDLLQQFENYHDPVPEIITMTKNEHLIWNDITDLSPLPHYAFGNILLIGDAAHATTPNMGQGACQAIEDAVVLAEEVKKEKYIPDAFKAFETKRMERTQHIVQQSRLIGNVAQIQNNFVGQLRNTLMRSLSANAQEKQLKKILDINF